MTARSPSRSFPPLLLASVRDALSAKLLSAPPNAIRTRPDRATSLRSAHRPDRADRGRRGRLGLRSRRPFNSAGFAGGAMGDVEATAGVPSGRSARPKRMRPGPGLQLPLRDQAEPPSRERNATRTRPSANASLQCQRPLAPTSPRNDREENQNDSARDDGVALHSRHERPARPRRVARLPGKSRESRSLGRWAWMTFGTRGR